MLVVYGAYRYYQLTTQNNLYMPIAEEQGTNDESLEEEEAPEISKWGSIIWLSILTIWIAVLSQHLVNAIEGASDALGIPVAFVSVILLPIVGNAAEHAGAIMFAIKDKLDISLGVAIGSSTQIAMFGDGTSNYFKGLMLLLCFFIVAAVKLVGKIVTKLAKGLLKNVGVSSYPLELDNILDREIMFQVAIKKDNIEQYDEVYTVLKFSDDKDLIKQYCPYSSEETCIYPEFNHEQLTPRGNDLTDSVAENEVNSASNTPTKRSRSESESSVVDIDEDPTAQLSSSKRKKVIKKEKIT